MRTRRSRLAVLLLLGLARGAAADVFYANPVTGDDASDGKTPATAFRTAARGLQAIARAWSYPGPIYHTLYLAPGVYDEARGESFPWGVPPGTSIVGAGSSRTIALVTSTSKALSVYESNFIDPSGSSATGISFRAVGVGGAPVAFDIPVTKTFGGRSFVLGDVRFSGFASAAVTAGSYGNSSITLRASRCRFNGMRLDFHPRDYYDVALGADIRNCLFVNSSIDFNGTSYANAGKVYVVNNTFIDSGIRYTVHTAESTASLAIVNNVFMTSGTPIFEDYSSLSGKLQIRNNVFDGARLAGGELCNQSRVFIARTEAELNALPNCARNRVTDPGLIGRGDYHLAAGSPCIDSGEAAAVFDDFDGEFRPLDGDGDAVAVIDVGFDEYHP